MEDATSHPLHFPPGLREKKWGPLTVISSVDSHIGDADQPIDQVLVPGWDDECEDGDSHENLLEVGG